MENTLLIGLSRQTVLERQLDVVANNIANVNTAGFKADQSLFEEYLTSGAHEDNFKPGDRRVSYVQDRGTYRDFAQGAPEQTKNPLDVAITGDAFLVVQTAGGERYTRDGGLQLNNTGQLVTAAGNAVLDEFLAADIVVLGAPMYNFTIPSQLKAWIDRIVVAGKTFKYGAQGPEGLAGGKRLIVAVSRGGFYGAGTPMAVGEHLETYLRWVFGFIGITNPEFVYADGIQLGPEHREKALAGALQAATDLHAA